MKIPLRAAPIDALLSGGFESGIITEIFGEAGTGKTNICLQLGREISIQGNKVAYVDTEGVSMERLRQMCGDQYEDLLKNLLVYKPMNLDEQGRTLQSIEKLPDLGLVVVDSVNIYTRRGVVDEPDMDRRFLDHLLHLQRIARERLIPVIVTSQVYGSRDSVQPFSGRTMAHLAKTIIRLEKVETNEPSSGRRRAVIVKHRSEPEFKAIEFNLTGIGVQ